MDMRTLANKLVEMCNELKNFEVMQQMYADDIASVEPSGKATTGKQAVIDKSKRWAEANEIHGETVAGPYFHGPDKFATQTTFEVTRKDTGQRATLNEVTVYTVKGGLIVREEFFFGGDEW